MCRSQPGRRTERRGPGGRPGPAIPALAPGRLPRRGRPSGRPSLPVAVPAIPTLDLRRGARPGPRRPGVAQRGPGPAGRPRLPVQRASWHRQDVDGPDTGQGAQLHRSARRRAVRRVPLVRGDRPGLLPRRPRARRRLQQRGGGDARPRLTGGSWDPGAPEGLHRRRGPHALDRGLERAVEDARGTAGPRGLRAGHHRSPEGGAHHPEPHPALRIPAPRPRDPRRAVGPGPHRRRPRGPRRGAGPGRPAGAGLGP